MAKRRQINNLKTVLTLASKAWYPGKVKNVGTRTGTKKTTRLPCNSRKQYEERLLEKKLLPINMYMELHDVLFLYGGKTRRLLCHHRSTT